MSLFKRKKSDKGQMSDSDKNEREKRIGEIVKSSITSNIKKIPIEEVATTVLSVIDKIRWDDEGKAQKGRHYPFAFMLDDRFINKLNERVNEVINKLPSFQGFEPHPVVRHPEPIL